jgi:hypothetical protein
MCKESDVEEDEKVRANMWVSKKIWEDLSVIQKETGRSKLDLVREALWRFVRDYNTILETKND